jgi:hypothetical protein
MNNDQEPKSDNRASADVVLLNYAQQSARPVPENRERTSEKGPFESPFGPLKLADEFKSKSYHPVLVFGTRASGKSMMLLSLFAFLNFDLESPGNCHFGDEIISPENIDPAFDSWRRRNHQQAKTIYDNDVPNFYYGKLAPSTRVDNPIFIPVEFVPTGDLEPFRLAFMESQGEFIQVDPERNKGSVKLQDEIDNIYKTYNRGLSIIFVAPSRLGEDKVMSDEEYQEMRVSDQSLYDCLRHYNEPRKGVAKERDRFLFLFSKWDNLVRPISHSPGISASFLSPDEALLHREIRKKFGMSWAYFQKMPQKFRRNVMHYCAGLSVDGEILQIPEEERRYFAQFPAALWSWLENHAHEERSFNRTSNRIYQKLFSILNR